MYFSQGLCGKSWKQEHKRDMKLEEKFLRNKKSNKREVQHIERAELNKHLALFVLWEVTETSEKWWRRIWIAGVPGEKPSVTSDKLPDSPSKFPCIQLWMTRRIWHCIKKMT